jgi:hypothetical protein
MDINPIERLEAWAVNIGEDSAKLKINPKYIDYVVFGPFPADQLTQWNIRECDRDDWKDWMPYCIAQNGITARVYYVNVRPESAQYDNILLLRVTGGAHASFEEWQGTSIVNAWPAKRTTPAEGSAEETKELFTYFKQFVPTNKLK